MDQMHITQRQQDRARVAQQHAINATSDRNIVVAAKIAGLGPKAFEQTLSEAWEAHASLRAEFGTYEAYAAFMKADAAGRVKLRAPGRNS